MKDSLSAAFVSALALTLAACGETARLPFSATTGLEPTIPAPNRALIPTINIAPAQGWVDGAMPTGASGTRVTAFAGGLDHPRWVYCAAQRRRAGGRNERARAAGGTQGHQGLDDEAWFRSGPAPACPAPTASRCCATPTATAWRRRARCSSTDSTRPSAWRWSATSSTSPIPMPSCASPTREGETRITAPRDQGRRPAGRAINHHWTKNLIASRDGSKLYVTVGSNSNVAENGMESEEGRAAIWEIDRATGAKRLFAIRPAQSRTASPGSQRPARCGPWSTSATSSAATWCPTT